jgi:hypothetical protein
VFRDGRVSAELAGDLTQDDIIHATFGSPAEPGELNPKGAAR